MHRIEFDTLVRRALEDESAFGRFCTVLHEGEMVLAALGAVWKGLVVGAYGHARYLPACRAWREHLRSDSEGESMPVLRARLGGVHKGLYARQKRSFEALVHLLVEVPSSSSLPRTLVDYWWNLLKSAESKALRQGRSR